MEKIVVNKILIIISLCILFDRALAANPLARSLSMEIKNRPLKSALDDIAQEAAFHWSYNPQILPNGRVVNLTVKNTTVREILKSILGEGFTIKENGNYVILKKEKLRDNLLNGYLTDPKTGEGLANATVYDSRTLRAMVTDSSGYFELTIRRPAPIVISKIGYPEKRIGVRSLDSLHYPIHIEMPPPDTRATTSEPRFYTQSEIELFFNASINIWHQLNLPDSLQRNFQVSFLPKLGTNQVLDRKVKNKFSLNILAGQSKGVQIAEVGGLGNFTHGNVQGLQVGGLFNWVDGEVHGLQIGGLFNRNSQRVLGVQIGGLHSHSSETVGVSLGGISTWHKNIKGVQIGGIANFSNEMRGVAVAGIFNHAKKVKGLQLGGIANLSNEIEGVAVSGIFNSSKKVFGVQISLINQCKELQGLQIGLINISEKRVLPLINFDKNRKNKQNVLKRIE